jgi:hypothetical protein
VKRQGFESWSENIHGKASKCAAWKKYKIKNWQGDIMSKGADTKEVVIIRWVKAILEWFFSKPSLF